MGVGGKLCKSVIQLEVLKKKTISWLVWNASSSIISKYWATLERQTSRGKLFCDISCKAMCE